MRRCAFFLAAAYSWGAAIAVAAEQPAASRVASVGLFKNGLAVVQRVVDVPGAGVYRVDDVPEPVHGAFWVESDARVVTQLTRRVVEVPARRSGAVDFQEELAGKEVTVHFVDPAIPPVSGTVADLPPAAGEDAWNRQYDQPRYGYYGYYGSPGYPGANPQGATLVLQTAKGRSYVAASRIAHLEAKDAGATVRQRRPVLLFRVEDAKVPAKIVVSYLARGLAWAPSYRVDLTDPKSLSLTQQAVIKNELGPLDDAEVGLISGFPSVQFAHVTSPLSLRTTWAGFFQQLNQPRGAAHSILSNAITQQAVVGNTSPNPGIDLSATPTGEGVDLHYESVGKLSLGEGDAASLDVATGRAPYDRVIEWIVPDTRDAYGNPIQEHERRQDPDKHQDAAWDAIRFRNPLAFPMTTGPATIVSGGRFNGQRLSYWVNAGEETTLHVTKALSLRTRSVEQELAGQREELWIAGVRYHKTTVQGDLLMNNHRKQAVTVVVRRRFSGDLVAADREPKTALLEEGVYSVNKRNQLTWTVDLAPGEEVKLSYRYTVLARS